MFTRKIREEMVILVAFHHGQKEKIKQTEEILNVFLPLPDTWLGEIFPDVHHADETFLKDLFGMCLPRKPEKIMIPVFKHGLII